MDAEHNVKQLERLTFFSDAVFAIAMTLLVVDVRLPAAAMLDNQQLDRALWGLAPHYLGFVISFLVIGRFWLAHHRVFGLLARTSERLLWCNMIVLLTIAFMPFPTAVVSEWGHLRDAVIFYAGWLLVIGVAQRALVAVALKRPGLVRDDVSEEECRHLRRGSWTPSVVGFSALAAACVSGELGAAMLVLGSPVAFWFFHRGGSVATTAAKSAELPASNV